MRQKCSPLEIAASECQNVGSASPAAPAPMTLAASCPACDLVHKVIVTKTDVFKGNTEVLMLQDGNRI